MRRVVVESPYAGTHAEPDVRRLECLRNQDYARMALRDCFLRGEAPFASHLLYTQDGVLRDEDPEERALGIRAGLMWGPVSSCVVVYTDLGTSRGMAEGIKAANDRGATVERRQLGDTWWMSTQAIRWMREIDAMIREIAADAAPRGEVVRA